MLFTHRGLSGPAILQISSYWREGERDRPRCCPTLDFAALAEGRAPRNGRQALQTALAEFLPKRLAQIVAESATASPASLADLSDKALARLRRRRERLAIKPAGSEGYRTAEVTLGGVDTRATRFPDHAARTCPASISSASAST